MSKGNVTWRGLSLVAAILALLVGAFAFGMGNFGRGLVHDQLTQEKIVMPVEAAMKGLPQSDVNALKPFAGQPLDTSEKAQAYANHYMWVHMQEACAEVKSADGSKTYEAVQADKCTYAGIGNYARSETLPADAKAAYGALRTSNFQGDMLRGALLNTYGWSILATIGFWAGIGLIIVGLLLLAAAFTVLRPKVQPTA